MLNYEGSQTPKPYFDIDTVSVDRAALRGRINNRTSVPGQAFDPFKASLNGKFQYSAGFSYKTVLTQTRLIPPQSSLMTCLKLVCLRCLFSYFAVLRMFLGVKLWVVVCCPQPLNSVRCGLCGDLATRLHRRLRLSRPLCLRFSSTGKPKPRALAEFTKESTCGLVLQGCGHVYLRFRMKWIVLALFARSLARC